MLIVTVDQIPGKEIEVLGLVRGSCVQSRHIGKDIGQALKSVVGGELQAYTAMMNDARDTAVSRMEEEAVKMGADAVVGVRFTTAAVVAGAAEILAFGTAVRFV